MYEIYVRSFQDSDGDGVGDLRGVIDRLDYLAWLGLDAIWLTPFYTSPMVDGGYDVASYTDVDLLFGSLETFDRLLEEAHRRGLRVVIDLVPNHTSDRHPWFIDSRRSVHAEHRDWYLWRDPGPDGGPPNNWLSVFGGGAWQFDEGTGQYYLHTFAREQPDLNWRNPSVRDAMVRVMRFWLDRGVDGFRIDVLWCLIKDEHFRDNPINPDYVPGAMPAYEQLVDAYSCDQPEIRDVVAELRRVMDGYEDRVLIGELYLPVTRLVEYYGPRGRGGVHLPFNFHLITLPWKARVIQAMIDRYEGLLPAQAWPTWVLGNHDKPRAASRLGTQQARVAALLLLSLRGTPTIYYGEELGMLNGLVPPELMTDPQERMAPGLGLAREPFRTPMPWDSSRDAGFSSGRPWLPTAEPVVASVDRQIADPTSFLSLYRRLLKLRRSERALQVGRYAPIVARGDLIAFRRIQGDDELVVAVNLGHDAIELSIPGDPTLSELERLVGAPRPDPVQGTLNLAGDDGVVARVLPRA